MFKWYRESQVCYVYLSDFDPLPAGSLELEMRQDLINTRIRQCRWFTRGWTLQELIAPTEVLFFNRNWNYIGSKLDLCGILSQITNIEPPILMDSFQDKKEFSITNTGLRMEDALLRLSQGSDLNLLLCLGCVEANERTGGEPMWLGGRLKFTVWFPNTGPPRNIFIQTNLGANDAWHAESLMNTGIVITYGDGVADIMQEDTRLGLPYSPRGGLWGDEPLRGGQLIFHTHGQDNFLGIHFFRTVETDQRIKPAIDVVVVCALQWTGSSQELRLAIFVADDTKMDFWLEDMRAGHDDILKQMKDMLLLRYSDPSGLLVQRILPTRVYVVRGTRLAVRRAVDRTSTSHPGQENYYRVLLEKVSVDSML
ncbi:hypothetical protein B0H67DRAFT_663731 [Lasiosphaeris hirsuta]|uniref:Uncharacterized protein n=1 Tax=Lasiosphaeris hirsuta TaxID=260670 RepID=A0AA40ASC5_9PEZI|nr:hypothetical protein B0H67DRAFT_663731 [Lasiosphaeris hirsuta]